MISWDAAFCNQPYGRTCGYGTKAKRVVDAEVFSDLAIRYTINGDSGNIHLLTSRGHSVQAN